MAAKRVVAVDDHPANLDSLCALLRLWGYEVDGAEDGQRALSLAFTRHADIVIVDLALPDGDALDVIRRSRPRTTTSSSSRSRAGTTSRRRPSGPAPTPSCRSRTSMRSSASSRTGAGRRPRAVRTPRRRPDDADGRVRGCAPSDPGLTPRRPRRRLVTWQGNPPRNDSSSRRAATSATSAGRADGSRASRKTSAARSPGTATGARSAARSRVRVTGATARRGSARSDAQGLTIVPKGKRKGRQLAWRDLVSGEAALAVALNASLATSSRPPRRSR